MKAAPPPDGHIIETVTQKRVLPDPSPAVSKERTTPEFWEYFEKLTPSEWDRHMLYIYRRDSDTGPMVQLEKCVGWMALPDQSRVMLTDREETEYAIAQKFGGGTYRLILKRGSERITEGRVTCEGPRRSGQMPLDYGTGGTYAGPTVSSLDATAEVANHAISTIAGHERSAVDVGVAALRAGAEVVQRFSQGNVASSATDDLMKQAMVALLQRALAPPPDPIETMTKLLGVIAPLMGGGGGMSGGPMVGKVVDAAIERLLNPAPSGPVSSAGAELVRQLPQVAGYVSEAIREWRLGSEAQRDTAAIMTRVPGQAPPAPPTAARPGLPASATVLAPPPPAAAANSTGTQVVAPSLEFIESKILELFREPISAEESADRTVAFLDTMDPKMVEQLKALGEAGLLQLFQARPVLRPALQNLPRLQEFIRKFLHFANEELPAGVIELAPVASKPI